MFFSMKSSRTLNGKTSERLAGSTMVPFMHKSFQSVQIITGCRTLKEELKVSGAETASILCVGYWKNIAANPLYALDRNLNQQKQK